MAQYYYNHELHNQEIFGEIRSSYLLARFKVALTERRAILYQGIV